jgi:C1A family cysteine protease
MPVPDLTARPNPQAWMGLRRDMRDPRDVEFKPKALRMPASDTKLLQFIPPRKDQGPIGSCTAHGVEGAMRTLFKKVGEEDFSLSTLGLYWDTRFREGTVMEDAGAEIRNAIKSANAGVGREEIWPYDTARFMETPPGSYYDDGVFQQALKYRRVAPLSSTMVKQAIIRGFPVVIGILLYGSFDTDKVAATGIVPTPTREDYDVQLGGHCMYVVGFEKRHFIVVNSWGEDWGDKGLCYIPEAYIGSTKHGADYWTIEEAR